MFSEFNELAYHLPVSPQTFLHVSLWFQATPLDSRNGQLLVSVNSQDMIQKSTLRVCDSTVNRYRLLLNSPGCLDLWWLLHDDFKWRGDCRPSYDVVNWLWWLQSGMCDVFDWQGDYTLSQDVVNWHGDCSDVFDLRNDCRPACMTSLIAVLSAEWRVFGVVTADCHAWRHVLAWWLQNGTCDVVDWRGDYRHVWRQELPLVIRRVFHGLTWWLQ